MLARRIWIAVIAAGIGLAAFGAEAAHHEAKAPRVFVVYTADVQLGHVGDYNTIVVNDVLPILKKHEVELVGAFTNGLGGPSNQVILIMGYKDLAHIQKAHADPDLRKVQAEKFSTIRVLEANVLMPTDYSPLH